MKQVEESFLWGIATSAFQQEGYIENDMTDWETLGCFKENGKNPMYGNGSAYWKRWRKDFKLLPELNINAYRFSIEWARIEPHPGQYDRKALNTYKKMIGELHRMGIRPMLTLHHFTHPRWFHSTCPWHEEQSVEYFTRYCDVLLEELGKQVSYYITFNEPLVWALAAYADAKFPPGEKNLDHMMAALKHMLMAHRIIYDRIKQINKQARVGIAKNFIIFKPGRSWFLPDQGVCRLIENFYNFMLLNAFQKNRLTCKFPFLLDYDQEIQLDDAIDFWGINYYYRMHAAFRMSLKKPIALYFKNESKAGMSAMGWENYPKGLKRVIRWVRQTGKDMMITENGIATNDDQARMDYIRKHIKIVRKAVKKGIPLKGYFYWTLLDNYEWLEGKAARFGLISVDYDKDYKRSPRESARYFARLVSEQNI